MKQYHFTDSNCWNLSWCFYLVGLYNSHSQRGKLMRHAFSSKIITSMFQLKTYARKLGLHSSTARRSAGFFSTSSVLSKETACALLTQRTSEQEVKSWNQLPPPPATDLK